MAQLDVDTEFLYMYGVIPAEELQTLEVPSIMGIDQNPATVKTFKEIAVITTQVSAQDFSQQQIDLQLKDAEWLKEKAFHHHECITAIYKNFTILPMSFCTIFQNEGNLESLLTDQYDAFRQKLSVLKGKQEWNLKLFRNTETALSYVLRHNTAVVDLSEKLTSMPKGKQFLMKKKLEQLIVSELEEEQSRWWVDINKHLKSLVAETNLRRNWGKEVTERNDEMIVNCDFLIDEDKTEQFLNKMEEIEKLFETMGCTFHVTGPWPPYHFSKMAMEIE